MPPNPLHPASPLALFDGMVDIDDGLFDDMDDDDRTHTFSHSSVFPTEFDNTHHDVDGIRIGDKRNTNATMNSSADTTADETNGGCDDTTNHHRGVLHDGDSSNSSSNNDPNHCHGTHGANTAMGGSSSSSSAAGLDIDSYIRCNINNSNNNNFNDGQHNTANDRDDDDDVASDYSLCSLDELSFSPPPMMPAPEPPRITVAVPTTTPSPTPTRTTKGLSVDDMLSKELLQLSFHDRNAINEEIHGVHCLAVQETPELLATTLAGLARELQTIPYKPAYDKAQAYSKIPKHAATSYVNKDAFRLKFLRCELFDVRKAAVRLLRYLDLMVELYGLFALQRTVTLNDFSMEEMQILRAGYFQIFPFRDRSGRRIMCIVGNLGIRYDPTLRTKAYFYFWMTAAEDVETQQKGVVFLVWPGATDEMRHIPNETDRSLHSKSNAAAPIRIAAVHFCFPNKPFFHLLRNIMAMTLSAAYRLRLKFHVGEGLEVLYSLKTYGIPVDLTPITDSGNVKTTYLKNWLRLRKIVEVGLTPSGTKTSTVSIIECPRSKDVIFRPGTSMLCHPGNVVFRGLIEAKQNRITVKKAEKEVVALEIIEEVKAIGGRFLMWDNGGWWSELEDVTAISVKISISYRDFKTKVKTLVQERQRKQQSRQDFDSSTYAFIQEDGRKRKRWCVESL